MSGMVWEGRVPVTVSDVEITSHDKDFVMIDFMVSQVVDGGL